MGSDVTPLFDAFDIALGQLCAGFNVPCTNERRAAYRTAFGKLHIAGWQRLVEYCLTEKGPDKFPTVKQLWGLRSEMRAHGREGNTIPQEPEPYMDPWLIYANRLFLAYIRVKLGRNPRAWGDPDSEQQRRATEMAIGWKNMFALLMSSAGNDTSASDRAELWESHMREAEKEIARAM